MDYSPSNVTDTEAVSAAAAGVAVVFILLIFAVSYAIYAFLLSRLFKKAGVPQWAAWVPIYNMWKLFELGGQSGFWVLLSFIPFVGLVSLIIMYIAMYDIGRKLGKEGWFVLVAIFLPVIWLIWLGFDDSKWPRAKSASAKKSGTVATKKA